MELHTLAGQHQQAADLLLRPLWGEALWGLSQQVGWPPRLPAARLKQLVQARDILQAAVGPAPEGSSRTTTTTTKTALTTSSTATNTMQDLCALQLGLTCAQLGPTSSSRGASSSRPWQPAECQREAVQLFMDLASAAPAGRPRVSYAALVSGRAAWEAQVQAAAEACSQGSAGDRLGIARHLASTWDAYQRLLWEVRRVLELCAKGALLTDAADMGTLRVAMAFFGVATHPKDAARVVLLVPHAHWVPPHETHNQKQPGQPSILRKDFGKYASG